MPEILSFPRLNHINYTEWSIQMEAILVHANLWALVTSDKKVAVDEKDAEKIKDFQKQQATCKAEMVLHVDDSQLSHMGGVIPSLYGKLWQKSIVFKVLVFAFSSAVNLSLHPCPNCKAWKAGSGMYDCMPAASKMLMSRSPMKK